MLIWLMWFGGHGWSRGKMLMLKIGRLDIGKMFPVAHLFIVLMVLPGRNDSLFTFLQSPFSIVSYLRERASII